MEETPVLIGQRIRLRPPRERDKADRRSCRRVPEEYQMYGMGAEHMRPDSVENSDAWFATYQANPNHWAIEYEGSCIGTTRLSRMDQDNRSARFSIGIFDSSKWNQGIGTEATCLVLDYAFEALKLHRIELYVLELNLRAFSCYKKCGFVIEGKARDSVLVGQAWQSEIVMSILEGEYRKSV
jgi:[ribosomal protein S5]-alanine N-acetyltransferase